MKVRKSQAAARRPGAHRGGLPHRETPGYPRERRSAARVAELMSAEVITCTPEMDLGRVGWLMWEGDCGALPVVREGRVIGMITDRDLGLAAAMKPRACSEILVAEAMSTSDVAFVRPTTTLDEALGLMARRRVRRLPVLDAEDRLVGLLSLTDALRKSDSAASHRILATLRAIAEPRHPATI